MFKKYGFKPAISIDFDGAITSTDNYDNPQKPRKNAAKVINAWRKEGILVIINTLRTTPEEVKVAKDYLELHGIGWDLFNRNPQERIDKFTDSRKISADLMIDDRNIGGISDDFTDMDFEVRVKLLDKPTCSSCGYWLFKDGSCLRSECKNY